MNELIQQIIDNPVPSLIVVGNLVIIESLLSVDNAAVLATMVMDLPEKQRNRALKYGIFGAYFFRGLAMIFASFLIKIWWLKPVGGLYLLYLGLPRLMKNPSEKSAGYTALVVVCALVVGFILQMVAGLITAPVPAAEGGIGCLAMDQVKSFYDKMVAAGVVKAGVDPASVVSTEFTCKKVGMELKK